MAGVSPYLAAAGVATEAAQGIGAYTRMRRLQKQLSGMPDPRYSINNNLLSYYDQALQESANPQGISTGERGAYLNDIAKGETLAQRTAQTIGAPGSSVNYLVNTIGGGGRNNLARIDASRRFGNRQAAFGRVGSAVNTFQNISNRNTDLDVQEQTYLGQAISDARKSANNVLGNVANAAIGIGAQGMIGATPPNQYQMTQVPQFQGDVMNSYSPQLYSGFNSYGRPRSAMRWMNQPYIGQ